jgi:hypothetical protein
MKRWLLALCLCEIAMCEDKIKFNQDFCCMVVVVLEISLSNARRVSFNFHEMD